jgi:thioredoxin-related protein
MKSFTITAMFFILMLGNNIFAQSVEANGIAKALKITEKSSEQSIQWVSFQEAIEKSKKKPKKIFIDVYTDWCGWCKVMDKQTFTDPLIIEYMNANFYAVKMNAEKDEKIEFKGKEYNFVAQSGRGYHELAAELMSGRMSYPTVVFLDEKMDLLQPIPGFRKPAEMDLILKFFGGDHYKNTSYDIFQQKYKSPYEAE